MKTFQSLIFLMLCGITLHSQPQWLWAKTFSGFNNEYGRSVFDNSGNIYCIGRFEGTVDFDPGPGNATFTSPTFSPDIYICKFNPSGNLLWAKTISSSSTETATAVAVDPVNNDVYVGGNFYNTLDFDPGPAVFNVTSAGFNDIYILKLDSMGNFIWVKAIGGPSGELMSGIACESQGANIYVTGIFSTPLDLDPGADSTILIPEGDTDAFVLKLDNNGNFLWAHKLGSDGINNETIGTPCIKPGHGSVLLSGTFSDTVDFDFGPAAFIMTGGYNAIYLLHIDSAGNFLWAKAAAEGAAAGASGPVTDEYQNIYISGLFSDTADFDPGPGIHTLAPDYYDGYILSFDSSGNFRNAINIGGSGLDNMTGLLTSGNGIYATGSFSDTADLDPGPGTQWFISAGSTDIYLLHLDTTLAYNWARRYGSNIGDSGGTLDQDSSGMILLSGQFSSASLSFDGNTISNSGSPNTNVYFAVFDPGPVSSTGNVHEKETVSVFPNPANEFITVHPGIEQTYAISIANMTGKICSNVVMKGPSLQINTSHLEAGIYILRLLTKDTLTEHKFVILR